MDNIADRYNNINSILFEFRLSKVSSPKELVYTLAADMLLFGTLRSKIKKMMKRSKIDRALSAELLSIVGTPYIIRILDDKRILSFEYYKTIWISSGLVKLLSSDELIAVILHEIGHGDDKIRIIYDRLSHKAKTPKETRRSFRVLRQLIRHQGVRTDALNMVNVYLMTYIVYYSVMGYPFEGLYKWSYGDLAIQYGYWDEYKSAVSKIDKYATLHRKSKLVDQIIKSTKK